MQNETLKCDSKPACLFSSEMFCFSAEKEAGDLWLYKVFGKNQFLYDRIFI